MPRRVGTFLLVLALLLDELEKAHPDVQSVLMQVMERGVLTDGRGRRIDFRNTLLVVTSNVGAERARREIGFGDEGDGAKEAQQRERFGQAMKAHFALELLDRFDEVVVFRSLSDEDMRRIVDLQVRQVESRLARRRLRLRLTDAARELLARKGTTPGGGARPLRRTVETALETGLTDLLLHGLVTDGDTLEVEVEGEALRIRRL